MIDLHTHTLFSDGELLPSELVRRAEVKGYSALALTDHVDFSNINQVVPSLVAASRRLNQTGRLTVIPGAEITHVSPEDIPVLVKLAKELGAVLVVVHGETLVEPVRPGTNLAAVRSKIDVLAHPGLLSEEEARIAAERGVAVELTSRHGHSLGNGLTALRWYQFHFPLVLNTDTHGPEDLIDDDMAKKIMLGSGIRPDDVAEIMKNSHSLLERKVLEFEHQDE
ncbi:MAG: histidinol phosphate phosphatase domain-containing protein [Candidatus Omnitrophica bacterium]|nr:histidinol phosphate phosphatase domain-containing protein [Candidatus Omnitrophota bacterium]